MSDKKRKKGIRKTVQAANKQRNNNKNKEKDKKGLRLAHKSKSKKAKRYRGDTMNEPGMFCEVYGDTIRNRILENLLVSDFVGIAVGDLARESKISKPKAYQEIYALENQGIVKKHRIIGKTQIYIINEENALVKVLKKSVKLCIQLVLDEQREKPEVHVNQENESVANNS